MVLVETTKVKKSNPLFKDLDLLCFYAKNLYNATLYEIRQRYFKTKTYTKFTDLSKEFIAENQADFRKLPCSVSQQVMRMVDNNFKSFFALKKKNLPAKIPHYLDKDGRFVVHYTKNALSLPKPGYVKLTKIRRPKDYVSDEYNPSDHDIFIPTRCKDIQFLRLVPKPNSINIEIGYLVEEAVKEINDNYAAIDLGVNNLMTVVSNVAEPFIINGKPLKSMNQYYNKTLAQLQAITPKRRTKRMIGLTEKRNAKVKDYLHKKSRFLVNYLIDHDINTLIIGYTKGWKQNINLGKVDNQKIYFIPFLTLVEMLKYKCQLAGIRVIIQDEAYTSKCSFLDDEEISSHEKYLGTRIYRGLFISSSGETLNADVNSAFNILKKGLMSENLWTDQLSEKCKYLATHGNLIKV